MTVLTWSGPRPGGQLGTLQCRDGHAFLPAVTEGDVPKWDAVLRHICNQMPALPPWIQQVHAWMTTLGLTPINYEQRFAWSMPEGYDLEAAIAAAGDANPIDGLSVTIAPETRAVHGLGETAPGTTVSAKPLDVKKLNLDKLKGMAQELGITAQDDWKRKDYIAAIEAVTEGDGK